MHLVTLGVIKKLLLLWIKGPLKERLPSSKVNQLSKMSLNFLASSQGNLEHYKKWHVGKRQNLAHFYCILAVSH